MLRKIALFIVAIIAPLASPAFAGEVEVQKFKDCPTAADEQGHVDRYAVPVGDECGSRMPSHYSYVDVRLGMQFSGPSAGNLIPIGQAVEAAAVDPADAGKMCVKLYPDGTVLEWIVSKGSACTRNWNRYARRYFNGQVFVFPANYGMAIENLKPLGKQRALDTIAIAKGEKIANK